MDSTTTLPKRGNSVLTETHRRTQPEPGPSPKCSNRVKSESSFTTGILSPSSKEVLNTKLIAGDADSNGNKSHRIDTRSKFLKENRTPDNSSKFSSQKLRGAGSSTRAAGGSPYRSTGTGKHQQKFDINSPSSSFTNDAPTGTRCEASKSPYAPRRVHAECSQVFHRAGSLSKKAAQDSQSSVVTSQVFASVFNINDGPNQMTDEFPVTDRMRDLSLGKCKDKTLSSPLTKTDVRECMGMCLPDPKYKGDAISRLKNAGKSKARLSLSSLNSPLSSSSLRPMISTPKSMEKDTRLHQVQRDGSSNSISLGPHQGLASHPQSLTSTPPNSSVNDCARSTSRRPSFSPPPITPVAEEVQADITCMTEFSDLSVTTHSSLKKSKQPQAFRGYVTDVNNESQTPSPMSKFYNNKRHGKRRMVIGPLEKSAAGRRVSRKISFSAESMQGIQQIETDSQAVSTVDYPDQSKTEADLTEYSGMSARTDQSSVQECNIACDISWQLHNEMFECISERLSVMLDDQVELQREIQRYKVMYLKNIETFMHTLVQLFEDQYKNGSAMHYFKQNVVAKIRAEINSRVWHCVDNKCQFNIPYVMDGGLLVMERITEQFKTSAMHELFQMNEKLQANETESS